MKSLISIKISNSSKQIQTRRSRLRKKGIIDLRLMRAQQSLSPGADPDQDGSGFLPRTLGDVLGLGVRAFEVGSIKKSTLTQEAFLDGFNGIHVLEREDLVDRGDVLFDTEKVTVCANALERGPHGGDT